MYFDSLKTSTLEGATTTVYAQGGRGNTRLVAWEGERTLTFTMEDALISPAGFMILSGADLIEAGSEKDTEDTKKGSIKVHTTETTDDLTWASESNTLTIKLKQDPYYINDGEDYIYVMLMKDGEIFSEPYIATRTADKTITVADINSGGKRPAYDSDLTEKPEVVFVDYYVEKTGSTAQQINITPDKFGGNYYLEASTLFRTEDGIDLPAEFIIPNCKIQSNFTFNMASSGDPSTFTFTMDAFPDYTRFDKTTKVLAAIQVIEDVEDAINDVRASTVHTASTI